MNKKEIKKEHHAQMNKICKQRLKKYYIDAFYKDDAINDIINICLSHMKYKHIVRFYDVLQSNGFDKY